MGCNNIQRLRRTEKLRINAYQTQERGQDQSNSEPVAVFTANINPEQFSRSQEIVFNKNKAIGSSAQESQFSFTHPERLSFTILLDSMLNEGITLNLGNDVEGQVKKFQETCYDYDGEIHRPRFLRITWGKLRCSCVLESFNVSYSIFDQAGNPSRAEIMAYFRGDVSDQRRRLTENNNSPDITHVHLFKAGDTLPLLTRRYYGDASTFMEVARFNEIDHFREIQAGTEIQFPPVDQLTI